MMADCVNQVNALDKKGKAIRGKAERDIADVYVNEMIAFTKAFEQTRVIYLGERAFKAFYKREFDYKQPEADDRWDKELHDKKHPRK